MENRGKKDYRHQQAHRLAKQRHLAKVKPHKLTEDVCKTIDTLLKEEQWSPEQIVGRIEIKDDISIHHETIYRYIYENKNNGGTLHTHLRHYGKTYQKRNQKLGRHIGIPDRVDIDERPEVVNNRERLGDWEANTMIGKHHKGALVTLDERVSKLRFAFPLVRKKSNAVKEAIIALLLRH